MQKVIGEAIREVVGETSHVSHLKVGMGKGWVEGKDILPFWQA